MIRIDVKKLGRIPDEGGWREDSNQSARNNTGHARIAFEYVHVAVDDHSRLEFVEIRPDEKGSTCAGFLTGAAAFMVANGAPVERIMTDNAVRLPALGSLGGKAPITGVINVLAEYIQVRAQRPYQRLIDLDEQPADPVGGSSDLNGEVIIGLEAGPEKR